jgi:trimethylamine--corrinoid protein Co-methyltransferase
MNSLSLALKPKLDVISDEQIDQIHSATLEVLERTGVKITHPKALEILHGAGAKVDGNRVRIPAWMVNDALQKSPSRIVLGNRNGEHSVILKGDRSWFGSTLDCIDYLNPITEERRRFTSQDCRTAATLSDALPNYAWGMTFGLVADVPVNVADRVAARQALTYSEKPLVFCCSDINGLKDIYEMATLIVGSEGQFNASPNILLLTDPISPLVHADEVIEKMLFCAEKGIPQICYSGLQAGSTAPMTFAGTIVQGSAESLSGLVLTQLVRPGTPFIYGAFATVMDMRTTIFSYGAPEMSLMVAAMAKMAHYYELPFFGTGGCSDAKFPDPQAAAEATYSCLSSALSGADLVHDCGLLDHGSLVSPSYIVLVNEVLHMVNQYLLGVPISEETLALDLINSVGPGKHYLQTEHTLRHCHEVWYSGLFDRTLYSRWLGRGGKHFAERLREQTLEVMKHQPAPLPSEIIRELDRMAKHWQGDNSG